MDHIKRHYEESKKAYKENAENGAESHLAWYKDKYPSSFKILQMMEVENIKVFDPKQIVQMDSERIFEKKKWINYQEELTKQITQDLSNSFEEVVVHGLNLKGYKFESKKALQSFVKKHCMIEKNVDGTEQLFYVKNEIFLAFFQEMDMKTEYSENGGVKISANLGSYIYL